MIPTPGPRYLHLFDDALEPGFDDLPVHDGDGAVQELAERHHGRDAGQYLGTIEITRAPTGRPLVRVIDMTDEAERRAAAMRRREADPYPQSVVGSTA